MTRAGAAAGRAGALDQEEALLRRTLPAPWQVGQVSAAAFALSSEPVPQQASHATRVGTRRLALVPLNASREVDFHGLPNDRRRPGCARRRPVGRP